MESLIEAVDKVSYAIALAAGGILGHLLEARREAARVRNEAAIRRQMLAHEAALRRDIFELDSLVALQNSLSSYLASVWDILIRNHSRVLHGNPIAYPDDLRPTFGPVREMVTLKERLRDPKLRGMVDELISLVGELTHANTQEKLGGVSSRLDKAFRTLSEAVGVELRTILQPSAEDAGVN